MKNMYLLIFGLIVSTLVITGCESEDDEKVLSAQKCFNSLDDSLAGTGAAITAVQACSDKLGSVATKDAQLLRCGMELWVGGINNTRIFTAFDAMESAADNQKEAVIMDALVLANNPTGTTIADNAYTYCSQAEAPGMVYITALIRLGTYMEDAAAGDGTAANIVDECIADTTDCANAENGQMIIDTAELYCLGQSEDNEVCQAMNAAIDANAGDPAATIADFLSQINF